MTANAHESDLALALELADLARTISLTMFRGSFGQRRKADGSIVTDADEAVERAIRERLQRDRPYDAMLGEEGGEFGTGPRRWIVDAIDGTHSFAQGGEQWGTLIALEVHDEVVVGVCDMAPRDRRYWAARGQGAFRRQGTADPARLGVSPGETLAESRCFVPGHEWLPAADQQRGHRLAGMTLPQSADDHPALQVAAGELELAVFFMGGPWDIAAPSIVVTEAGGRFSDLAGGNSLALQGGVFSNGHVHQSALDVVRRRQPVL
jgi:histidinol-phosphatase